MKWGPCSNCQGSNLFRSADIGSGTGHGPDLLPGLGGLFTRGHFHVIVCRDCGLMRFFADPETTDKLLDSGRWARVP